MKHGYECYDCRHKFEIDVTQAELDSYLGVVDGPRTDVCAECGRLVGTHELRCERCTRTYTVAVPHWHMMCNLFVGSCPGCSYRRISPCIC
jgi:hypothetical protein